MVAFFRSFIKLKQIQVSYFFYLIFFHGRNREETLGPETSVQNLTNPYFMQYQIQAVNEMVSASINHPSILFHAFYNEGPRFMCKSSDQSRINHANKQ